MSFYAGEPPVPAKFKVGARVLYSSLGLSYMPGRVVEGPYRRGSKTYLVLLDGDKFFSGGGVHEVLWVGLKKQGRGLVADLAGMLDMGDGHGDIGHGVFPF
jgi:hypothetical protein